MKGYMVPRKAGWDTHGLPVELEVEKKLGLDGKEQIEEYGMEPVSYTHLDVYKRQEVISIPVSDGTERDFAIMDTFEFEGQGYLAVSLIEGDEIQEGVYIYRYHNAEDGDCLLYTSRCV